MFRVGRFAGNQAAGNSSAEVTSSSRAGDLESMKQELMADMRQELQKIKDEIVQGLIRFATCTVESVMRKTVHSAILCSIFVQIRSISIQVGIIDFNIKKSYTKYKVQCTYQKMK